MQQGECKLEVVVTIFVMKSFSNMKSATCTHVSGLLHALVALSPSKSVPPPVADRNDYDSEDELPVTSYRCQ